jgi:hypothetical protein
MRSAAGLKSGFDTFDDLAKDRVFAKRCLPLGQVSTPDRAA